MTRTLRSAAIAIGAIVAVLVVWRFLAVLIAGAFVALLVVVMLAMIVSYLVRRHPLADALLGWLLYRHHERRKARTGARWAPPNPWTRSR